MYDKVAKYDCKTLPGLREERFLFVKFQEFTFSKAQFVVIRGVIDTSVAYL